MFLHGQMKYNYRSLNYSTCCAHKLKTIQHLKDKVNNKAVAMLEGSQDIKADLCLKYWDPSE